MKTYFYLTLTIFILLFSSCNDEVVINDFQENSELVSYDDIKVLNGRLYFPNESIFQNFYSDLKEKEENEIADVLDRKFYSKEFYSLKPIVNDKTEEFQMQRHLKKIKNNKKGIQYKTAVAPVSDEELIDNFDDLEDVFGESVFASFLNQEAELQVADDIYKYTDTGLFIAKENEIESLNSYLDEEQISRNLLEPTSEPIRDAYIEEHNPDGGTVRVKEFEHFLPEDEFSDTTENNVITQVSNPTPTNVDDILKTIDVCSGTKPFIANLFGKTKVCIDKYESRRRVKVKYYNVNLKLAYSIGVKVKHQYKGWTGLWRKQDTDEMALGVNSVTWAFDHTKLIPKSSRAYPIRFYTYDGELYETIDNYYNAVFIGKNKPMPPLPFAKKLDVVVEFVTDGYTPLKNEYEVRKFFYENLFNVTKSVMSSYRKRELKRIGVIINVDKKTWVQYYAFNRMCTDCDKLETVFDWGVATPAISYTFDSPSGFSWDNFDLKFDMDFRRPDNTGVNLYGIAKRNGKWYGKRMVW